MTRAATAYAELKAVFHQISNLRYISSILARDGETVMAKGSGRDRDEQQAVLAKIVNETMSHPRIKDLMEAAKAGMSNLTEADRRNLQLMEHEWVHNAGLPSSLVAEQAKLASLGERLHTEFHKKGRWQDMRDQYDAMFRIMREVGAAKQSMLKAASPYEALVDSYSPGLKDDVIRRDFSELDRILPGMLAAAQHRQALSSEPLALKGPFPTRQQKRLNMEMARRFGFDFQHGVMYTIKGHPSCAGSPDDVRITTRLESNILSGLMAIIHETGHAGYEQNLPQDWRYQPAGHAVGMAIHESQSMIMEYQAAMSQPFLTFLSQRLRDVFNLHNDSSLEPDNMLRLLWRAEPSLIRVEADELTYPMHILLRTDLERALIVGDMDVDDLPDAWNEGMAKRLGVVPPDAPRGCLQDVHFPAGLVGYFPAYVYGAMGAAQFMQTAVEQFPGIMDELGRGVTETLRTWLKANVHNKGSLLETDALFTSATGRPLNTEPYLNHLRRRYVEGPG